MHRPGESYPKKMNFLIVKMTLMIIIVDASVIIFFRQLKERISETFGTR